MPLAQSKIFGYNEKHRGPQRFRQVGEILPVIQVESESPLVNQRLKQNSNCEQHRSFRS